MVGDVGKGGVRARVGDFGIGAVRPMVGEVGMGPECRELLPGGGGGFL